MAGWPIQLWNEWATQILLLLSFTLQVVLFGFSGIRRRRSSTVLALFLWLAYLMADSTTVYTLGHLSITSAPDKHKLVVFWAPFLLVHLGSQDTITAYALEDNQLWPRHLLTLGVQASGVAYVLYNYITEIPTSLARATILMFIVGLIKYGERIWALRSARLDTIRSSFSRTQYVSINSALRGPGLGTDDDGLFLMAHAMLPISKGAMADQRVSLSWYMEWGTRALCHLDLNWKDRCRVVEIELSLMYDVLYTKAAVIYTWYGYLSRLLWPLTTVAAFRLFQLSGNKYGDSRIDVAITYILLVGAFLLDMASLFRALGSTWTCSFLLSRGWSKFGHAIMSLRRLVKAAGGNVGWSGSVEQLNLLQLCSSTQINLLRSIHMIDVARLALSKLLFTKTLVISKDVKEVLFQHVWQVLKEARDAEAKYASKEPMNMRRHTTYGFYEPAGFEFDPESWEDTSRRRMALDEALGSGAELQHAILTCHILTDVFVLGSGTKDAVSSSTYVEGIKALSDYMVFLLVMHADTILGLELRNMYEETRQDLERLWRAYNSATSNSAKKNERLASILRYYTDSNDNLSIVISRGILYAKLLLELVDMRNPDKSGVISSCKDHAAMDQLKRLMPDLETSCRDGVFDMPKALALIFDAWVRLLISVSVRCSRDAHARQINRGSELTTVVWLIVEHAAIFLNPPDSTEDGSVPASPAL